MPNVIVGIHGLANKPEKDVLARWWEQSIREGLEKNCHIRRADFTYQSVYWADLLYKYPLHNDQAFDFDELYNSEPYRPAKNGKLKKYKDGWLDVARGLVQVPAGRALDALREYVGLDTLASAFLEKKLKDLAFYYNTRHKIADRMGKKREARRVLMDELRNVLLPLKGQHVTLIAHSMGSIVAYDVLRDLGQEDRGFALAHFVTIGSPLGLPTVKANVYKERQYATVPVRTPSVVTESWVNYADRRDPVAVDFHLGDDYGPNDRGVQVRDDLVLNDYDSPSHHKSYGYLRTPELSEHLKDFLKPGRTKKIAA